MCRAYLCHRGSQFLTFFPTFLWSGKKYHAIIQGSMAAISAFLIGASGKNSRFSLVSKVVRQKYASQTKLSRQYSTTATNVRPPANHISHWRADRWTQAGREAGHLDRLGIFQSLLLAILASWVVNLAQPRNFRRDLPICRKVLTVARSMRGSFALSTSKRLMLLIKLEQWRSRFGMCPRLASL
jgi:hypothetical protein